jgi:hypothetical protein
MGYSDHGQTIHDPGIVFGEVAFGATSTETRATSWLPLEKTMSDIDKSKIDRKAQGYRSLKTRLGEPEALFEDMAYFAEAERIENLSDEELESELRAKGLDPADVPSLEELLARVKQKALTSTAPTGQPPQRVSSSAVAPFPAWSITLAIPLPFTREPFEDVLAEHSRLLEKYAERLLFLTRKHATSTEPHIPVVDLTGVIVGRRDGEEDDVRVDLRGDAAYYVASYRGVLRPLLFRPDPSRMPIVVVARNVISLHMASIQIAANGDPAARHPTLIVEPRELAVEPLDQEHRESGLGPLLVTRWKHPDGEDRYAWVPIPSEPATPDEAVDRVLAQYEGVVRHKLRTFLSTSGAEARPLVLVMSVPSYGDGVDVSAGPGLDPQFEEWFPTIVRALKDRPAQGHVPVVVCLGEHAALRWIALPGEERTVPPPPLLASLEESVEAGMPGGGSSQPSDVDRKPKSRTRSDGEVFEAIMRMTCFDEIDEVLGAMSDDKLDRAIAGEGFDPTAERSHGPGLRDRVVRAIANRRLREHPPEGV